MTNDGFNPIFSPRGNGAAYCGLGVVVFSSLSLFSYLQADKNYEYGVAMYLLCMSILAMFLGELVRRACLLGEELWHMRERYDGKWRRLFAKVFSSNYLAKDVTLVCVFVLFTFCSCHYYKDNWEAISADGGRYFMLLFQNIAIVPIIGYLAGIREPTAVETSEMNERYNKNLADGLAWSYYFGYLKLILPEELDRGVIRSPEARENIDPVKLFILIPMNCFCPKTLNDQCIKVDVNLPSVSLSRGGVHDRTYHQTVQKITIPAGNLSVENEKYSGTYYCLAEYATPLITLCEMTKYQKLSKEECRNQVKLFYDKLRVILDEDHECTGKYELLLLPENCDDLAMRIVKKLRNAPLDIAG